MGRSWSTTVLAALVCVTGCGMPSGGSASGTADSIPGPSLTGPNVVHYPLEPYSFAGDAQKEIRQGFRSGNGCGQEGSATSGPDDPEVQEIVIAEDPDTCQFLVVTGTPADD